MLGFLTSVALAVPIDHILETTFRWKVEYETEAGNRVQHYQIEFREACFDRVEELEQEEVVVTSRCSLDFRTLY